MTTGVAEHLVLRKERPMKLRHIFIWEGLLVGGFGLGFLLAPALLLGLYGTSTDACGITMIRLLGASAMAHAILQLLARDEAETRAGRAIAWAKVVFVLLGGVIVIRAILSGVFNAVAWGLVGIFGIIEVCLLCLLFRKPDESRDRVTVPAP
jgi:hypothetical protein